jgi:hypothetical protein
MIEDRREGQSKFDRPQAGSGMPAQVVPPAVVVAPPAGQPTPATARPVSGPDADAEDDADYEEDEVPLTFTDRLRRLSPAVVVLTLGSIGSLVFLLMAVTSHTTPVAVLLSAAVVTGLIFGADAVIASVSTWRASRSGEIGRALLGAVVGGFASLICFLALAGTLILVLVLNS